jgi:flagellar biosynthesis anti-sigma factor FlgM
MKINGTPPLDLTPVAPRRGSSTSATASSLSDPPAASVVVSTSAASASAARARVDSAVEQRISVLRTEVSTGSYRPDLERLADRLVDEELARAGGGHDRG